MIVSSAILRNTRREDKPNEDFFVCDDEKRIYILLDGVSRDAIDGHYPNPSPATVVSKLIGNSIYRSLSTKNLVPSGIASEIHSAVVNSNRLVHEYNTINNLSFPAGAVGIIAIIKNCRLYYCYIGDCTGRIIRNSSISIFTSAQTALIQKHKKEFTSYEIRYEICNNPRHLYAYGVLNGDIRAESFLRFGTIDLMRNDIILLSSDGLEDFLSKQDVTVLSSNTAKQLIDLAVSENNTLQDDRTIIKIIV